MLKDAKGRDVAEEDTVLIPCKIKVVDHTGNRAILEPLGSSPTGKAGTFAADGPQIIRANDGDDTSYQAKTDGPRTILR